MNEVEKKFEEVKFEFPHYSYYQKTLQVKGFKLISCNYHERTGALVIYSKYSEKLGKSLFIKITFDERIEIYDNDSGFIKVFEGKTLKQAWHNMCGDEEVLKKFSEFESL